MRKALLVMTIVLFSLVIFAACSDDDTPTNSTLPPVLADTTAHMATDILTYFGGDGWDWGTSVIRTPDNGFLIAGSTDSYGSGKNTLYLVKSDSTGKEMWSKIFGGAGEDNAEAMALTNDNNVIIGGVTSSFSGNYDLYLLKVSLNGDLIWEKSLGSTDFEWGTDIAVLSDGYAICGYMITPSTGGDGGDFVILRTDLGGNTLWSKTFSRPDREWPYAMTATSDGGFLLAGLIHPDGVNNVDIFLIKTDDTGGVVWEEAYGGSGDERAFAVTETSDGGYVVAGSTRSFSFANLEQAYVVKVDAGGTMIWDEYFGDGGNLQARDIIENPDGSLVLTGNTTDVGTGVGIAKLDASGNLLWNENIGLIATGMSICTDAGGGYTVTGFATDTIVSGEVDALLMHVTER